ncbi:hypothetical protein E4P41_10290 [Geodermatophilus sp. DF01-2]|uniref:hypothetical protein n=1 Tax=Geodermatophilus sp. DF01-2 TaxID=2559610 RepID=UPI0010744CA8|nr:hypothetical protein [Geodermatophilus sp. DF01_2]TFV60894.1 hypothetical protein E4P41_10290 [Geodermatophilus sp. DF01_2]
MSTMWTLAPAGARGPVGIVARTTACPAVSPVATRLRAVPVTAAVATVVPAARVIGTGVFGAPATGFLGTAGYAQQDSKRPNDQHDNGTTLGIHSPRRPSS